LGYNGALTFAPPGPVPAIAPQPLPDPSPPFGRFRLDGPRGALLRAAQRMPPTWMGRRAALALRKVVLRTAGPTIDAEVEGLRLRLYPRSNVCERKFLFMPRMFDPVERALIDAELPADGVFVDIGANVGLYTLWAARRLGEGGRVLAVEPNPVAFGRLTCNLALNGLEGRVTAVPCGVADREGAFDLHLDATNLGGGSLVETGGETIRVPCLPLDGLLAAHGIERVDILKIDVEGAEELVLPPFLERAPAALRPRTILIEESSARWRGDLIGTLESHGYRVTTRTRMNLILRLEAGD
jgi:FkbM family methyltransferase